MAEAPSGGSSGYEYRAEPARVAFASVAAQQAQATLSGASARPNLVGGSVTGGVDTNTRKDAAPAGWGAVGNIVDAVLQPKIKQAQQENFWKGVTAARGGQAITDIVAEQSPLSRIFGPSDYVQGAQFYTAQDRLAKYNQDMIANADELARVPPSELGKRLNEDSQKALTGDPGTDLLIQSSWVEQTGPALAVINRTRFAQQQAAATEAWVGNATTNAGTLQSLATRLTNGTATRDDYNAQLKITAEAFMMPPGMSPETYRSLLPKQARAFADQGNFHAVTFMKQSGALSHMDPAERQRLDDFIERKEKQAATQYRYDHIEQLAMDKGALDSGAMTPQEWLRRTKERNKLFQTETGVVDTPLVPFTEQEAGALKGVNNWYEAQAKIATQNRVASEKAATAAEKAEKEAREASQINLLLSTGSAGEAGMYQIPRAQVDAVAVAQYEQSKTPEAGDQLLIQNWKGTKYVNEVLVNRFAQGLRATVSGDYSPAVEAAAANYQRLASTPGGAAAAAAYYSTEDRTRLQRFQMLKQAGQPAPVAFKVAFQDPLTQALDYTKNYGDDKDIRNVVKDRFTTWFGTTSDGRAPLDDFSLRIVSDLVNKNVKTVQVNTGLSTEQAAKQEVNHLLANGLEVYGGSAWVKQPNQGKLETYIRSEKNTGQYQYNAVPPQTLDKVFTQHIADGLKSVGAKDVEAYQVVRTGDTQGVAHFHIISYTKDGGNGPYYSFSSDDLSRSYEKYLSGQYKAPPTKPRDVPKPSSTMRNQ